MHLAPVVDELVFEDHALGQEKREAGAFIEHGEQAELLAQTAVVTLFGLLEPRQIGVQLALFREGGAVNARKHLVFLAAAPVGAGAGGELDRLDRRGGHQVRTGAQVGEVALRIKADGLALAGMLIHQLDFIRLVGHELMRFLNIQREPLDRQCGLRNRGHFLFELFEVLGGERRFLIEIVIEAVVDGRADGKLRVREQVHNRLREDVGSGVVERALAVLVLESQDFQRTVLGQRGAQVAHLAVDACRAGRAVQVHRNVAAERLDGGVFLHLADIAALECDIEHNQNPFLCLYNVYTAGHLRKNKTPRPGKGTRCISRGSTLIQPRCAQLFRRPITEPTGAP